MFKENQVYYITRIKSGRAPIGFDMLIVFFIATESAVICEDRVYRTVMLYACSSIFFSQFECITLFLHHTLSIFTD